jgi:hypothetical protein
VQQQRFLTVGLHDWLLLWVLPVLWRPGQRPPQDVEQQR